MKSFKKFFVLLLCFVLCLSAVACKPKDQSGTDNSGESEPPLTGALLVDEGTTDFVIVKPALASSMENTAVSELHFFFKEATGIGLNIVTDTGRELTPDSHYISVGDTSLFNEECSLPEDLGRNGTFIKTVEESVFINGYDGEGCLYAVYEFLGMVFDYEFYGQECYKINRNVNNQALQVFDYAYTPSFPERSAHGYHEMNNKLNLQRTRHTEWYSTILKPGMNAAHNYMDYIAGLESAHPKWINDEYSQSLCLTAHGDPEEYAALLDQITAVVKRTLMSDSLKNFMNFSAPDGAPTCTCEHCNAKIAEYGGYDIALDILIVNEVRDRISEWFETPEGKPYARDFTFAVFAYMATEHAPVEYNAETGKYEGVNGLKFTEGAGVYYAPIYHDYTRSIYDPVNADTLRNFQGWSDISDVMNLWGYDNNFSTNLEPYWTFNHMQEFAQFAAGLGNVQHYFMQSAPQTSTSDVNSAWTNLHAYLNAKIGWNVNVNVEECIVDFFENFYGPAGDIMYDLFTKCGAHISYLMSAYPDYYGRYSCQKQQTSEEYWSKSMLEDWLAEYDKAYAEIEHLRYDFPEQYRAYYERIATEEISPLYLLLRFYSSSIDTATLNEYKAYFKQISDDVNVQGYWSSTDRFATYDILGIAY